MRKRFAIPAILLAFVFGVGIAGSSASETPAPSPEIIEVPGPTQTIEIEVIREVEIPSNLSDACQLALVDLWYLTSDLSEELAAIEADYFDYPDETLTDFGRRVEVRVFQWQEDFATREVPDTTICYR